MDRDLQRRQKVRLARRARSALLLAATIALGGCAIVFDAPSREGVQLQAKGNDDAGSFAEASRSMPDTATIDLTRPGEDGPGARREALAHGDTDMDTRIRSESVLRLLKERRGGGAAERSMRRGIARFDARRFAEARLAFEAAVAGNPPQREWHALARMYLGFIRCIAGDTEGGALEFRRMYAEVPAFETAAHGIEVEKWAATLAKVRTRYQWAVTTDRGPEAAAVGATGFETAGAGRFVVSRPGGPHAQISLAVSPGGRIVFDGQEVGWTPPARMLTVAPGLHTLKIVRDAAPPVTAELDIREGERIEVQHRQH